MCVFCRADDTHRGYGREYHLPRLRSEEAGRTMLPLASQTRLAQGPLDKGQQVQWLRSRVWLTLRTPSTGRTGNQVFVLRLVVAHFVSLAVPC